MKFNKCFDYVELDVETLPNGVRHYISPTGERLPSVTTILSATKDMTQLHEWRKRIGDEKADREVKEAQGVGNLMHKHVEDHILGVERTRKSNFVHSLAYDMAENIINRGLIFCDEIWGVEIPVYFPGAYAGRSDLIGVYKGKPAIMDHKNSKKMKKREWLEDYRLQGCAYALAHNELYNTNINQVVLFMSARDLSYETFVFEGLDFHNGADEWIKRLEQYFEMQEKIK